MVGVGCHSKDTKIILSFIVFTFWLFLSADDTSLDWMLRHGRSSALFVALKECPSVVYTDNFCDKLHRVVLSFLVADRVSGFNRL